MMYRTILCAAVAVALAAVSCQSAVHRSYPVPGEGAGDGLKYYRQYKSEQGTQPEQTDNQPHE